MLHFCATPCVRLSPEAVPPGRSISAPCLHLNSVEFCACPFVAQHITKGFPLTEKMLRETKVGKVRRFLDLYSHPLAQPLPIAVVHVFMLATH